MPDVILKHVPGMATAAPVPVVDAATLTQDFFLREHVAYSRPCIVRGAVNHWEATKKWADLDYLKIAGDHPVGYWPHERHISVKRLKVDREALPFTGALARIQAAPVAAFHCSTPEPLAADIGGFPFLGGQEKGLLYSLTRLIFFKNAGTSWHYHPFDETLMCQVKGPKRIGLLDVRNPFHRYLRHIFFKEDYYDHPYAFEGLASGDLEWLVADLQTGDALYIPPLWWHGVIPVDDEVGVTVPITWRSPQPVIADSIRKMAAGEIDLLGTLPAEDVQRLFDFAKSIGVEQELRLAFARGMQEGRVGIGTPDD
jgi:quercetin dioxygenase-like cupin family protein